MGAGHNIDRCTLTGVGESVEPLRRAVELAMSGIALLDAQCRFLVAYPAFAAMLDETPQSLAARSFRDFFAPHCQGKLQRAIDEAQGEDPAHAVLIARLPSGRAFPAAVSLVDTGDGYYCFMRSLGSDSLNAAAPTQHSLMSRTMINAIDDGFAMVDEDGQLVFVNDRLCEMTGYGREELLGCWPPYPYWPDDQVDRIMQAFGKRASHTTREDELVFQRKNGERFVVSVRSSSSRDSSYRVSMATISDLSAIKARDAQIADMHMLLTTMASAGDLGTWHWDLTDNSAHVSDSYYTLLGYEPGAWPASYDGWAGRVHPDDIAAAVESLDALRTDQARIYDAEMRMIDANGEWRWVLSRAYVTARTSDGEPACITGIMQDIHRLKTQELKLRQFENMEVLGQMTGGIAHDFNNVLAVLYGNIELLGETASPEQAVFVKGLRDALLRGKNLTQSLLRFSRKETTPPREVDVNAFVESIRDVLRTAVPAAAELELALGATPARVMVDPGAFEHALLNLVLNAGDALASRGSRITISTMRDGGDTAHDVHAPAASPPRITVAVSDDGEGMSADVAARAADPLFTTKPRGKGTGLGLSMAKKFVEQADGELRIASRPGRGTTVEMIFPAADADLPDVAADVSDDIPGRHGAPTVLLVDDEPVLLEIVRTQLEKIGCRVVTAGDPSAALALLETHDIDLLLTDIVMPFTMDGLDLARAVRVRRPDLDVLFMTGYADGDRRVQAGSIGAVIAKPFSQQQLRDAVHAAAR